MNFNIIDGYNNKQIRTAYKKGEVWFVAKDVCDILDIQNHRDTVAKCLDDDEKGVETVYSPGGNQETIIINESGLYNLIFRSNKPEARAFRKWVTSEVLPAIRKTGMYFSKNKLVERAKEIAAEIDQLHAYLVWVYELKSKRDTLKIITSRTPEVEIAAIEENLRKMEEETV